MNFNPIKGHYALSRFSLQKRERFTDKAFEWEPQKKAENILSASGATIKHDQSNRAFYRRGEDAIHLPPKENFDAPDKYYATALHELGHWTGDEKRLNREKGPFGFELYAREELRAEIASWMLGQEIGIGHDPEQHAAYVESWIKALKEDPYEIVRACRDAEKIKEYVIGLEQKKELQQEAPENTVLWKNDLEKKEDIADMMGLTLRKTFGYIQRTQYGVGFEVLCKRFNHVNPTVTMRYLGINDSEVMEILQNKV